MTALDRIGRVLTLALLTAPVAAAEPGHVQAGQSEGQGWIFKLGDACWVATAGHVVEHSNTAIVRGPGGVQGEAVEMWKGVQGLDLALIRLAGPLALACPASSLGDRDSRPMLKSAIAQGRTVALERRSLQGDTGLFGAEIVPMLVLGVPETEATIFLRSVDPANDAIGQTDSGSPIRLRGTGVGEAGMPLGLIFEVDGDTGTATAIRMDVVRAAAEAIAASSAALVAGGAKNAATAGPPMTLLDFTGVSPSTECAPLNIFRTDASCGWRVKKSGRESVKLALAFKNPRTDLSTVTLTFAAGLAPRGVSFATRIDGQPADGWSSDRYCRMAGDTVLACGLGQRTAAALRLTFDGEAVELISVRVQ